ncbi:C-type lectin domain and C-type lectin-like domain and C-type lectin fold domain-containing protein [Strongyloides ratti]|uniref:C-type lectin domain and C-type lectin-like domain and C-type lectin fold domain-containing protein n=1 Tax=Strongyloides ratti TaxID=34506 RepID=A0A090L3D8_STRRB|nr:C-type lectin domain and C-type lectin-like domain and C-type lectin fold domain-containing protein [Strongyloides ratti]CEF64192.1 C-type lectin domain and C-type lectin-like domain and C-type lectin fold domain-containing protein [Strongyloides ratti]
MKEDQRCYKLYEKESSRDEAASLCKNDKAYLPTIESNSEERVIFKLLNDTLETFWLGLKCTNETSCFWDDGHILGDYKNFINDTAYSNVGGCYYVIVDSSSQQYGEWIPEKCENVTKKFVICQQQSTTDQIFECPKDYSRNEENNDCYYYVSESMTFNEANENCKNKNSTLVSINTSEENMYVLNLSNDFDNKDGIWIGLTYINGTLQWVDGNPLTEWNNFKNDSSTDNEGKSIVLLTKEGDDFSKWVSIDSSSKYPSVCRFKI